MDINKRGLNTDGQIIIQRQKFIDPKVWVSCPGILRHSYGSKRLSVSLSYIMILARTEEEKCSYSRLKHIPQCLKRVRLSFAFFLVT